MIQEKLNHRLQILANLGIVAGLVLVGVQLKQNSDLLKMQLLYEESERSMSIENLVVGEDAAQVWAKSLTDAPGLTLAERRVLEAMLWSYTENLRATHMLSEMGLLRNEEWRLRVMADSAFYLANPYARAWWTNYTEDPELPQDLVDAVNTRLAGAAYDFTSGYMKAITTRLEEQSSANQQRAAPHIADDSPEAAIQAARARFNLAIEKQQLEGMANLFAPGYELVSGRGDRVQGPDAQLEMWRETFEKDPTFNCQRTPEQIDVNADWGLARETGHWLCTQTMEGLPAQYNGVYAAKWQTTVNSEWVLQSEVFTTLGCEGPPAACRQPDPID
ncbi:MAG TPA: DUF4440 domain-containing protein [Xanthomonadales bacterium]|nr:DUF4440 domain-containing protein [Xanthomonadales bacterium]